MQATDAKDSPPMKKLYIREQMLFVVVLDTAAKELTTSRTIKRTIRASKAKR